VNETAFRSAEQQIWDAVGLAPTEQVVDGVRVQIVGDGPPVVLVHGTTNIGASWADLVVRLPDRRCIAVDRPGCGLSPAAVHDYPALLPRVLDGLGLDAADVISTSYGSHFAVHSAIAHRERINRLVLLGWSVGAPVKHMPLLMRAGNNRAIGGLMARMPVSRSMVRSMLRQISVANPPPHIVDGMVGILRHTDTMRNEVKLGPPNVTEVRFTAEELASITAPTHLIWGADDAMGGEDEARAFAALIPGATLTLLPGVGHAPWLDQPDVVAVEVDRFLAA
jgi:pimeloyl-ACP methyl ester carboxylesterase